MGDTGERAGELVEQLRGEGVAGVTVAWADNNGIPRSRTVPVGVAAPGRRDRHRRQHRVRGLRHQRRHPVRRAGPRDALGRRAPRARPRPPDAARGPAGLAWAPGTQVAVDGVAVAVGPALAAGDDRRRARRRAATPRWWATRWSSRSRRPSPDGALVPAYRGPAYSPHAPARDRRLRHRPAARRRGQRAAHRAVARRVRAGAGRALARRHRPRHGPPTSSCWPARPSWPPPRATGCGSASRRCPRCRLAGNGWHVHTSLWRDGGNLLAGGPEGPAARPASATSRACCATCPRSRPSPRPRSARWPACGPGFFAGAYGVLGRREPRGPAALRRGLPAAGRRPRQRRAQGLRRLRQPLPRPHRAADRRRRRRRGEPRPAAPDRRGPGHLEEEGAGRRGRRDAARPPRPSRRPRCSRAPRLTEALGAERLGAFLAVRRADAAWAAERETEDVLAAWRWRY